MELQAEITKLRHRFPKTHQKSAAQAITTLNQQAVQVKPSVP